MNTQYKLRQCIDAHENDVKSVFVSTEANGFFSASRDLFVRLWMEENNQFQKRQQYRFHKSEISVVHFMKPCLQYQDGVILSAGYDKIIQGYLPHSTEEHFTLKGHSNTVTSIASNSNGYLISGSMDGTAILWDLDKCVPTQIFKGHSHGIWSLILLTSLPDYFLTASADKDVCLWNIRDNNRIVQKFSEHTDCVRGLMELPQSRRFLSCSNDSSIRMWCLVTKKLLSVFSGGHTDTVFALGRISDDRFASVGEGDRLYVWSIHCNSAPLQSILIPVQSIWCISVLQNGDLVTGSDDGYIRVFSEDSALQSGVELPQKSSIKLEKSFDESSILALPILGIEMLSLPGRSEGELMRVRDEDSCVLYEWSAKQKIWIKRRVLSDNPHIAKQTAINYDQLKKSTRILYTTKMPAVIIDNATFNGENVFVIKLDPFVNKENIFVARRSEIELDSPKTMSDFPSESDIEREFAKLDVGAGAKESRKFSCLSSSDSESETEIELEKNRKCSSSKYKELLEFLPFQSISDEEQSISDEESEPKWAEILYSRRRAAKKKRDRPPFYDESSIKASFLKYNRKQKSQK